MQQAFRLGLRIYLVGAALMAIYLSWMAVSGGALDRHHGPRDWLVIVVGYAAYVALWPVALIIVLLMYLGLVHGPIEW
jgi:hypothetical protein